MVDEQLLLALLSKASSLHVLVTRGRAAPVRIEPICMVKSDKTTALFFMIDFANQVSKLLEAARDTCSESGIFLEHDFHD